MPELTDEILAAWLRPATTTLEAEDLAALRAATSAVVASLTSSTAFHVASLAYGVATDDARAWFVDRVRGAIDVGQDALIARLACCSMVEALNNGEGTGVLLCLLAQSAGFVGGTAAESELDAVVAAAHRNHAAVARVRPQWSPVSESVAKILTDGPQTDDAEETAETPADVHERAVNRLAEALDLLAEQVEQRGDMVDEEYDALWWSYTRRSETTGSVWSAVAPLPKRIVLVANELGQKLSLVPSPPIARGLLALALEGHVDDTVRLSEIMVAAAENDVAVVEGIQNRLLPISTAVARILELGADDNTWSNVLAKTLSLEVNTEHSALDMAMQLVREVEIGALL